MNDFVLTEDEKKTLLEIARTSIVKALDDEPLPEYAATSPGLREKCGAFVTLEIKSQLRGCIGNIESDQPLHKTVSEMAVASAFRDPRFPPLRRNELDRIVIEISVLSPLVKVADEREIKVGTHGIVIRKNIYSGLLLPQVAARYDWDAEEFLRQTCIKAGLSPETWKEKDCEIRVFSALVFKEGE